MVFCFLRYIDPSLRIREENFILRNFGFRDIDFTYRVHALERLRDLDLDLDFERRLRDLDFDFERRLLDLDLDLDLRLLDLVIAFFRHRAYALAYRLTDF